MSLEVERASGKECLAWLVRAAERGTVHTVRVGWSDRLGVWRGKRMPADEFLSDPERRIGFCDGMIIADVQCDIIQSTPFSNFATGGYPDMYLRPDLATLRPVGWQPGEAFILGDLQEHHGRPLDLMPRVLLDRVVEAVAERGVAVTAELDVCGRLMTDGGDPLPDDPLGRRAGERDDGPLRASLPALRESGVPAVGLRVADDGRFRLSLAPLPVRAAGDAAVVAKAALKELAHAHGLAATFMTVTRGVPAPSELGLRIGGDCPASAEAAMRLTACRALLQPSVNAFKAGCPSVASGSGGVLATGISSEADPVTALAVVIAAVFDETLVEGPAYPTTDLGGAVAQLREATWLREWLGDRFLDNALPLLEHEAALSAVAVTDWELARYWRNA